MGLCRIDDAGQAEPLIRQLIRGPMFQGDETALQADCGRFDSDGLHQLKRDEYKWN